VKSIIYQSLPAPSSASTSAAAAARCASLGTSLAAAAAGRCEAPAVPGMGSAVMSHAYMSNQ